MRTILLAIFIMGGETHLTNDVSYHHDPVAEYPEVCESLEVMKSYD